MIPIILPILILVFIVITAYQGTSKFKDVLKRGTGRSLTVEEQYAIRKFSSILGFCLGGLLGMIVAYFYYVP